MPPPQLLPSDHSTPRPRPRPPSRDRDSSVPVTAAKRAPPPPPPAAPATAKKMARPASAPDLTALPASARPRPRPPSTPAKNGAPAAKSATGRPAFMAPRGAQTVRPARRLPPGTAVYVRTTFRPRNVNIRCRILLWLRARVVSSPDAYHCTVKYAADLSDMFAGKIVSKPADHVRIAPRPMATKPKPEPSRVAPALQAKETSSSLPRR